MKNRSLVSIEDYSKDEILRILELSEYFEKNQSQKILDGKVVAMLFYEPSTRTRLSFESAVNKLGDARPPSPVFIQNQRLISFRQAHRRTVDASGNQKGHYLIRKGDRIAQLVLAEVPHMKLVVVSSVAGIGNDRGGGFGSTGIGPL